MKVTNNSQALQGVWFSGDLVWIKPGASHEADMTEAEAKLLDLNEQMKAVGKPVPDKADAAK